MIVEVGGFDSEKGGNTAVFKLDVVDCPWAGADTGLKLDTGTDGGDRITDGFK